MSLGRPRVSPPDAARMTERQRAVHDGIAAGPRGAVRGPLAVWLRRPEMAEVAQALGRYCRYETLLPPRLSELAILTIARAWGSEYEWYAHKPIALRAGVAAAVVEAIRDRRPPPFRRDDEEVVHAFTRIAQTERNVPDPLFARTVMVLGEDAVVDLVALNGYYAFISLSINVFGIPTPEDVPRELG